jgi:hypothetical protein
MAQVKVIQSQFPPPNLARLVEPYGDSSPMGLLWTFMGASHAYNIFVGSAEMLGGILLIIPPLATLGALVAIGTMGHVFILNMAYDVPVKLFSFHLIIMAAFIVLPDARRLANFFVLNRRVEPAVVRPLFKRRKLNIGMVCLQLLLLAGFISTSLVQAREGLNELRGQALEPALRGIWSVDEFTVDGQARPPLMTDAGRWRRVILEYSNRLSVQFMDKPQQRYSVKLDTKSKTITLTQREKPDWKATLAYESPQQDMMVFRGQVDGREVEAIMHRKDPSQFLLTNRGFHWINEYPFNR